eukprot:TRINITY_DN13915_c0_g1_i3.p1 TRINITY_DN13915_c0_g1~~TRINITY_DN13915_c0_g1_i3.p1  ORF type:complete len:1457 (+),score=511.02 TRINITY_DN13915_c0_g1_i3:83-4453(+)
MLGLPPQGLPPRPPGGLPPAGLPVRVPASDLPAAGQRRRSLQAAGAPSNPDEGVYGAKRPDHLWSVLHHRENSASPDAVAEASPELRRAGRPRSREGIGIRESRSEPRRAAQDLPPLQAPVPFQPASAPFVDRGEQLAYPVFSQQEVDWRQDLKALQPRPFVQVPSSTETLAWLERRLESAQTDQRAEVSRRFAAFEQTDKHFKDYVQREQEQLHSKIQQAQVQAQEGLQEHQRQVTSLTAQSQKQDMRLQGLESQLAQASANLHSIMSAVAQGAYGPGGANGGGTGEPPQALLGAAAAAANASANLEVLRAGLEREASARVALGSETADQFKELHRQLVELSGQVEQSVLVTRQQLQHQAAQEGHDSQRQAAKLSALEPGVAQLRSDMEQVRDQLQRTGADVHRRCEEVEATCGRQLQGVQEAALSAARELWEEHQGVVAECKSSLASLQQILESKDKIAEQLRSLQQQQRDDDRQEIFTELQRKHEDLRHKVMEAEQALSQEQRVRLQEQQRSDTTLSRLGLALEKAQGTWIKDSAKLAQEFSDVKRDVQQLVDGEARAFEKRLAEGLDTAQRRLDEVERKADATRSQLGSAEERIDLQARAQSADLQNSEGRMMRQLSDLQTIQAGRLQQAELAKAEQVAASERNILRKDLEDSEAKLLNALQSLDTRTAQRLQQSVDFERERTRQETTRLLEEERGARLKSEAERMASLQRRLQSHEEQVLRHLESLRLEQKASSERQQQQVEAAKGDLLEAVDNAEARSAKRLEDELNVEREKAREQLKAFMEDERGERLKAEAERLVSLQKRLQAHEELTTQRLQEQRGRLQDALDTQRQAAEARALEDKQELQREFHDFAQEQREKAQSLAEEVSALDNDIRSMAESIDETQRSLDQRLQDELASIAARLAVASAHQAAAEKRMADSAAEAHSLLKNEVEGSIGQLRNDLDNMSAEMLKLVQDESDKSDQKHTALEGRMSTLEVAVTASTKKLEAQDNALEAAIDEAKALNFQALTATKAALDVETGRLNEHLRRVEDSVQGVEAEVLQRLQGFEEVQSEAKRETDNSFGIVQAQLGEINARLDERGEVAEQLSAKISAAEELIAQNEKKAEEQHNEQQALLDEQRKAVEEQEQAFDTRASAIEELVGQEAIRATAAEEAIKQETHGLAALLAQQAGSTDQELKNVKELVAEQQKAAEEQSSGQQKVLEASLKEAEDRHKEQQELIETNRKEAEDLEEEVGKLKQLQEKALEDLAAQLKQVEEDEKKAAVEAAEKRAGLEKKLQQEEEKTSKLFEDMKKRMEQAEAAQTLLKREADALKQTQDQRLEDQGRVNKEVQQKQDSSIDDIQLIGQKLDDLSRQSEASAVLEEAVLESAKAQFRLDQDLAGLKDKSKALEDLLEDRVSEVQAKLDGGFEALLLRLEAERWVNENVDAVADTVTNKFLRNLDKRVEKLEGEGKR